MYDQEAVVHTVFCLIGSDTGAHHKGNKCVCSDTNTHGHCSHCAARVDKCLIK